MKITSFRIKNYKSFIDSGELKLSSGFNVIIGQNNVGKTALLEALCLKFIGKPHKSLKSVPRPTIPPNPISSAEVMLTVSGSELKDILLNFSYFHLPISATQNNEGAESIKQHLNNILSMPEISFKLDLNANQNNEASFQIAQFPSHGLFNNGNDSNYFAHFQTSSDKSRFTHKENTKLDKSLDFGSSVATYLRERVYIFRAERLNISSYSFGSNPTLAQNAQNLPEVLNLLQSTNPERFNRFNELVREVFPSIYRISVRAKANNQLEIVVWTEDPKTEREDLAIELSESGTGVGQVLAILYVIINSNFSRTIIIDEPNSFLHPSAARKLIEILGDFPEHQYIISTHSAEIVRAANPNTLTLLRWEKPQSIIEPLNIQQMKDVQRCLIEIGAKLSDVFGADNILWVEGQTEEECYPKILRHVAKHPLLGTSIVAVKNTGDIKGKHKALILDIYKKLSHGNALLPKAIAFIFDKEGLTSVEIEDIHRESNGLVSFLPKRTYENYLINPEALAAVMATLTTFKENLTTAEQITQWLISNGGKKKYVDIESKAIDIKSSEWLEKVHGAKLLEGLFVDFSDGKEQYRKTIHSIQITEWLIENKPDTFDELVNFLLKIFRINYDKNLIMN